MVTIYEVTLLDIDGLEISVGEFETTLAKAKQRAKYLLSDKYAAYCDTTHADWQTRKVEVRKNNECIWDAFLEVKKE